MPYFYNIIVTSSEIVVTIENILVTDGSVVVTGDGLLNLVAIRMNVKEKGDTILKIITAHNNDYTLT